MDEEDLVILYNVLFETFRDKRLLVRLLLQEKSTIHWVKAIKDYSKKNLEQGILLNIFFYIGSILGPPPEELIVPSKTSVGYDIIKNMGGVQRPTVVREPKKKIYGVTMPHAHDTSEDLPIFTEVKRDFPIGNFLSPLVHIEDVPPPKNDFTGVNLLGNAHEEEQEEYENIFNKIFKKHAGIEQNEVEEKKKESNRIAFGVTSFDDEDDEKYQCNQF